MTSQLLVVVVVAVVAILSMEVKTRLVVGTSRVGAHKTWKMISPSKLIVAAVVVADCVLLLLLLLVMMMMTVVML